MKLVQLKEIFEIYYGNSFDLTILEKTDKSDKEAVNYVSRTRENNGVSAVVKKIEGVAPFESGLISVAGSGNSVLETCIQPFPFYTGYHVFILRAITTLTDIEKLFYCHCIRLNRYKYSFGRQANKTLKDLWVPSKVPDKFANITFDKVLRLNEKQVLNQNISIDQTKWSYFKISEIFELDKCKCSNATGLLKEGSDVFYIGAKKRDNGVMRKVQYDEKLISDGNCIVFIGDGQGSVGYATYQPNEFIGSTTLTCGYNKNLNKYSAQFIVTVLDKERFKYSFGRKYGKNQLEKSKIKLPSKNGQPDFSYMENYIKSLKFSSNL